VSDVKKYKKNGAACQLSISHKTSRNYFTQVAECEIKTISCKIKSGSSLQLSGNIEQRCPLKQESEP